MDDDINKWLKQAKEAGLSDEKITEKLQADGWGKDKVFELLNPHNSKIRKEQPLQQPTLQTETPKKTIAHIIGVIVIGLILLILGIWMIANAGDDLSALAVYVLAIPLAIFGFMSIVLQVTRGSIISKVFGIIGLIIIVVSTILGTNAIEGEYWHEYFGWYITGGVILLTPLVRLYFKKRNIKELDCEKCNSKMKKQYKGKVQDESNKSLFLYLILLIIPIGWPIFIVLILFKFFSNLKEKGYWICGNCDNKFERKVIWFERLIY